MAFSTTPNNKPPNSSAINKETTVNPLITKLAQEDSRIGEDDACCMIDEKMKTYPSSPTHNVFLAKTRTLLHSSPLGTHCSGNDSITITEKNSDPLSSANGGQSVNHPLIKKLAQEDSRIGEDDLGICKKIMTSNDRQSSSPIDDMFLKKMKTISHSSHLGSTHSDNDSMIKDCDQPSTIKSRMINTPSFTVRVDTKNHIPECPSSPLAGAGKHSGRTQSENQKNGD